MTGQSDAAAERSAHTEERTYTTGLPAGVRDYGDTAEAAGVARLREEMERLRRSRDHYRTACMEADDRAQAAEAERDALREEIEALRADHAAALAAAEMRGREEAVRAIRAHRFACEFYPVGRSRGVPMLSPSAFKDQAAEVLRALPLPPGTDALDARLREERRKVWEEALSACAAVLQEQKDAGISLPFVAAVGGCQLCIDAIRARMEADDAAE